MMTDASLAICILITFCLFAFIYALGIIVEQNSRKVEKSLDGLEHKINNLSGIPHTEKSVQVVENMKYTNPKATTLHKVQFVFGAESYFTTKSISKALMFDNSELRIPHGTIFEVRKPDSTEPLFRIIVQNSEKMSAFETCTEYQTAPSTCPVWMDRDYSVSVYTAAESVKMRLHSGLTYQKVVGGSPLVDSEGRPFIDTLERDIEAYLIGDVATKPVVATPAMEKGAAATPVAEKPAEDKGVSKLNLVELGAENNPRITNVNHMTRLKILHATEETAAPTVPE